MVSWPLVVAAVIVAFVIGAIARPYLFDYDSLADCFGKLNQREE